MESKGYISLWALVVVVAVSVTGIVGSYFFVTTQSGDFASNNSKPEVLGETETASQEKKKNSEDVPEDLPEFVEMVSGLETVPADETGNNYVLLGATRTGTENKYKVAAGLTKYCQENGCRAIIHTGNVLATKGAQNVEDPVFETRFEVPYQKLENIPFYISLGNHDYLGNPDSYIEYAQVRENWKMPSRYYSVTDYDEINFIITDSQGLTADTESEQMKWLASELEQADKSEWSIVVGMKPLLTNVMASKSKMEWGAKDALPGILCENQADVYASGIFALEYFKELEDGCSTSQINSGGGGRDTLTVGDKTENTVFSESQHGFVVIKPSANTLTIEMVNHDGQVVESYQKEK
jgi:tartrate-resistant acid phosphatase type 5